MVISNGEQFHCLIQIIVIVMNVINGDYEANVHTCWQCINATFSVSVVEWSSLHCCSFRGVISKW